MTGPGAGASIHRRLAAGLARSAAGAALVLLPLLAACAPGKPARIQAAPVTLTASEAKARKESDEIESELRKSDVAVHDEKLQAMIDSVVARLLPALGAPGENVRVLVVRNPLLNAATLPNGFIYIHSGLLARFENEAQLANVLGHEIEHYLGRHTLRQEMAVEHERNKREAIVAASIFVALLGGGAHFANVATAHAASRIMIDGYQQDIERDADAAGVRAMAAAGYDATQAPLTFEFLAAEEAEGGVVEPYYYGQHPAIGERIRNCRQQVRLLGESGWTADGKRIGAAEYDEAVADLLLVNADLDLKLRRFGRARAAVDRHLRVRGDSARGHFVRGEVLRREAGGNTARLEAAAASYRRSVSIDPGNADAQRELGLVSRSLGHDAEARRHLARYLQLTPDAKDRAIVESYLR